jgi:hypothetical protein
VIMCSELVNYVAESVVANTSYGILVHVRRKSRGNLIQDSAFIIEILNGINMNNEDRFLQCHIRCG